MRLLHPSSWGITYKAVTITLAVSMGVWLILGHYQGQQLRQLFFEREYQALQAGAFDDRRLFDEYTQGIYRSAKLIGGQKRFLDYVNTLEEVSAQPSLEVAHQSTLPPWMPISSIMRTFYRARYAMLYDQQGFLRAVYHHQHEHEGGEALPNELHRKGAVLRKLSHNQAYLTTLDDAPYLLASERIRIARGYVTLLMVTPIDSQFLQEVTSLQEHSTVLALIDKQGERVLASSDLGRIAVGAKVNDLEQDYLVAAKSFFDYGSSDLNLQLSSFASVADVRHTVEALEAESNFQRGVLVVVMMLTFSFVSLLFVRRVLAVGRAVSYYSQHILGRDIEEQVNGDELSVLTAQLTNLGDEVVVLRNELHDEAELARRMADDLEARTNSLSLSNTNLIREIEERKRSERERDELHLQLQKAQRMDAIGQITGGVAHDFNNILAAILGHVELAAMKFGQDESSGVLMRYLDEIRRAGERGRGLVSSMMVFSRGEAGERRVLLLEQEVEEVMGMLRPTISSSIEIRSSVEDENLLVNFDPIKLQQIIMNLIVNARDSMPEEKGALQILLQRVNVDGVKCDSCHEEFSGEFVELSICDSGHGIPEKIRDQIFEPFFSTKKVGEGSGMGLSVTHGILHANEGHILLESVPGRGTCFRLLLKPATELALAADAGAEPAWIGGETVQGRGQIMVVDDEIALTHYLQELLEMEGYRVLTYTAPDNALRALQQRVDVDLLITDQTMPKMTGIELTEAVRKFAPQLPIIMCTGYSATTNEALAKFRGVNEYLNKPINRKQLLAAMERLLSEARRKG